MSELYLVIFRFADNIDCVDQYSTDYEVTEGQIGVCALLFSKAELQDTSFLQLQLVYSLCITVESVTVRKNTKGMMLTNIALFCLKKDLILFYMYKYFA